MSKLSDRIRRASRVEPAPLGFAAAARQSSPTMLCLVRLSKSEAGKLEEALKKGADGVLVEGLDPGKAKDAATKAGQGFVGAELEEGARKDVAALRDAGADFAAFDLESAMADALLEERIGLVLTLNGRAEDTTLRLLGDLGLDALIVPGPGDKLSVQELLGFRRLAALARTPLLTEIKADADTDLLQALREAGVVGVIVDSSAIGKLKSLRERIHSLPPRGRKKEERAEAMLPAGVMSSGGDHEHEDDDD